MGVNVLLEGGESGESGVNGETGLGNCQQMRGRSRRGARRTDDVARGHHGVRGVLRATSWNEHGARGRRISEKTGGSRRRRRKKDDAKHGENNLDMSARTHGVHARGLFV